MNDIDNATALLIRILAATDVIWTPFRHTHDNGRAASATNEARRAYRKQGVSLIGGGTDSERQNHSKLVGCLRDAGLVATVGRTRGLTCKLTARGRDIAATLAGGWRLDESWGLLELVVELQRIQPSKLGGQFYEVDVINAGRDFDMVKSADLRGLEHIALPLLERDFITTASDMETRVAYIVTPEGKAAAAAGCPKVSADLPKYSSACGDLYDSLYFAPLDDRDTWQPKNPNDLVIPLSAGLWQLHENSPRADELRRVIFPPRAEAAP